MNKVSKKDALEYHSQGRPGKIEINITKPVTTQRDLSLAYTPGVAEPVRQIAATPDTAYDYTAKGNLVAVITNGTAVLGLGNVGPLAGKPVMEGKGVLFKRFADIDVFDIEIDTTDPDEFVRVVKSLAPTFGGINLEDIKAPECFQIEEALRREMDIPVFHDDQHGTAIIAGAGLLNAVEIAGKQLDQVSIVFSGAGAAAIACAKFFISLGARKENITLCDSKGVVYASRSENMNQFKAEFAHETTARTLAQALQGADVFIGLSAKGLVNAQMLQTMAERPIIFALANPDPEIPYKEAKAARPDAIVASGRSDDPNQVNNVLGFPFIFRGALDVRATDINEDMKVAAARALAHLARQEVPEAVSRLYGVEKLRFGPDYIIPKTLDPRVLTWVAPAVAQAAMDTGVARIQLDLDDYSTSLTSRFGLARQVKEAVVARVRQQPRRVVYSAGENAKVIQAAARVKKEGIAHPILVGRTAVITAQMEQMGLSGQLEIVDPISSPLLVEYTRDFYALRQRRGVARSEAITLVQQPIYFATMMVRTGQADALVGGPITRASDVLQPAIQLIGTDNKAELVAGLSTIVAGNTIYFLTDTLVNVNPSAEELATIALMAEERVRVMGIEPRLAMLSFSNFGVSSSPAAEKMRQAAQIVKALRPEVVCDGEIQADLAVDHARLEAEHPFSDLTGPANVLVFPNLDAASIASNLLQALGNVDCVGTAFMGTAKPVYALSINDEVADIVETTAMAVSDVLSAQERQRIWSAHMANEPGNHNGSVHGVPLS